MAGRPSKMDQLPPELREAIEALWTSQRYTLDQLQGFLADLTSGKRSMLPPELAAAPAVPPDALPGRSGLHAHLQGLDKVAEKLHRSRAVAEALVKKLGDAPEDRVARLNIELLHGAIMDLFLAAGDGEGGETAGPVTFDPEAVMLLGKALKDLAAAKKADAETILRLRKEAAAEMVKKLDAAEKAAKAAGEKGLSTERITQLRLVLASGAA